MIIKPKIKGFICTTAHPIGCAMSVKEQISYVEDHIKIKNGPKNVLIIGASTGFGLASRITAAFGCNASTTGVFFERPSERGRTASTGWYQSVAFEREAEKRGIYSKSINGDAFSDEIKEEVISSIKDSGKKVDLVIYSLASPKRLHPRTGELLKSVLKPIGKTVVQKTINTNTGVVTETSVEPANDDEIRQTVGVMGGEDWKFWIEALKDADVLAEGVKTVAFSYVGPDITKPIYYNGTIGEAKKDLAKHANIITEILTSLNGRAIISVNKALVTQASSAIPVMPLYINILYKVMKEKGVHEGCIEQMFRLFSDRLYNGGEIPVDDEGRIRMDDLELREDIQEEVTELYKIINTENQNEIGNLSAYNEEFLKLFGFGFDGVDYETDVSEEEIGATFK